MIILYRLRRIVKQNGLMRGALFSLFSFVNKGFSFLLLLILANFILPAEYGYLSLFSTVVMVIGYFIDMSVHGYMSVAYFKEKNGLENAFSGIFTISLLSCLFFSILLFIGGDFLSEKLNLPCSILVLSLIISFTTVYANINLDYLRIKENVKQYGLLSCGNALLNFILSIVLVKICMLGWEGRVYAQTICCLLFGIIGLFFFISNGFLRRPNWGYIKGMLFWGIPLIPHLATIFIRQGCDRYIINEYHSIEDVGLFSFALNLVNIITMIGFGFNQSNSVDIYKTLGDKEQSCEERLSKLKNNRIRFIQLYIFSTLLISVCCYVLIPIVLPKYQSAMSFFLILAIYGFLVCMYLVYTNYLFFFKKTKTIMSITVSSSLLHFGLSLWLTKYSLFYTAVLYGATQLIVVVLIRYFGKRELNKFQNDQFTA